MTLVLAVKKKSHFVLTWLQQFIGGMGNCESNTTKFIFFSIDCFQKTVFLDSIQQLRAVSPNRFSTNEQIINNTEGQGKWHSVGDQLLINATTESKGI